MKNKFIVGSFVTKNTPYEDICEYFLKSSLKKFKIDHEIETIQNTNNWRRNVAEKPKVILNLLEKHKNKTLVFLDADASIEQYPALFEDIPKEYDLGYHLLDWATWYNRPDDTRKELLTGTMFFRYNERVVHLLKQWYIEAISSEQWEQLVLEKLMAHYKDDLEIYNLPVEYCYIKTMPNGDKPFVKCDPVILHHQVSRTLKKLIK
jgi:hypothetical protein